MLLTNVKQLCNRLPNMLLFILAGGIDQMGLKRLNNMHNVQWR